MLKLPNLNFEVSKESWYFHLNFQILTQSSNRNFQHQIKTSFQNGTKVRKKVCFFGFGLLRFVRYHHYSISMSVYCTAMKKLGDCWEKNMKKSIFGRNRVRFHCAYYLIYPDVILSGNMLTFTLVKFYLKFLPDILDSPAAAFPHFYPNLQLAPYFSIPFQNRR